MKVVTNVYLMRACESVFKIVRRLELMGAIKKKIETDIKMEKESLKAWLISTSKARSYDFDVRKF